MSCFINKYLLNTRLKLSHKSVSYCKHYLFVALLGEELGVGMDACSEEGIIWLAISHQLTALRTTLALDSAHSDCQLNNNVSVLKLI